MLMFTNNEAVEAFTPKTGKRVIIPAHCYVYIISANEQEYTVRKLCFGHNMVEVTKETFQKKFFRC